MLPWRQTRSENRASQQIDQGLLTFAKREEKNQFLTKLSGVTKVQCSVQHITASIESKKELVLMKNLLSLSLKATSSSIF